ncbi:colanic acid biosynthesis acetyltransferase WcaF [Priestia aryabhattai]|uniref:colanic acid biosynthesis acetyltransferase WcaF n=1 Tax=Priestia aryabhattai TaxID=412384 RepID=UPI003D292FA2
MIDLSKANPGSYRVKPKWFEALWMITELLFIYNPLQWSSKIRVFILNLFGATVASNVIIRPRVRIRFPWNLTIGKNSWIGESVWISNKGKVVIGENCAISQGTFITTGSHDVKRTMDVIIKEVHIKDGVWVTSKCIILQGVTLHKNAVITPGSVVVKDIPEAAIFGGNPAKFIKQRFE